MGQRIRTGDKVHVISGSDRGKQGKVLAVDLEKNRLRVQGVRIQKRHLKPGRRGARAGGIVEQEGYVDASNVLLVDTDGKPSRFRTEVRDTGRQRVFARSGDDVPAPERS